jgi:putative peptidoglycan lipid II flippase
VSLVRPTLVVAAGAVASRVLGLARDILFAHVLGAGPVSDAFLAAYRLPNLIRRVLAEGGLNPALIPALVKRPPRDAAAFAGAAFAGLLLALVALIGVVELSAGLAVLALAPGLAADPEVLALAALYTRLAFPLLGGVTLASFLAAVLNANRRFLAATLAPLAMNLLLVAALVALGGGTRSLADRAAWLAGAASAAGLVQLACVGIAFAGSQPAIRWRWPSGAKPLRDLLRTAALALLASGSFQLLVLVGTQAASFLPSGVSWLYYADKVVELPLGIVASIVGTVLLAELATHHAAGEGEALIAAQNRALALGGLVALPGAAALAILADPIARVLFERGAFGPEDAAGTAAALAALSLGLPFAVASKILTQTVFARGDTGSALLALAAALAAATVSALALAPAFGMAGVGVAVSIGAIVHTAVLGAVLARAGLWRIDPRLASRLGRTLLATGVMSAGLATALGLLGPIGTIDLAALCLGGLALYAAASWLLGAVTPDDVAALSKSR